MGTAPPTFQDSNVLTNYIIYPLNQQETQREKFSRCFLTNIFGCQHVCQAKKVAQVLVFLVK